jgi:uncharacterized protein (TIGR00369 family)
MSMNQVKRMARSTPFYRHLGIRLIGLRPGISELQMRVTRSLTQSAGVAHGGVAASLIDSAVGLALCTLIKPGQLITTVEMKLNYLAPVPLGTLKAKGKILHRGKRIAVGESEVRVKKALVAKGLVTYVILERKRTNAVL